MSTENLVLVDGDIVVYRVGFSSDGSDWKICKARADKMLSDILENTESGVMFGYLTDGKENYRNEIAVTAPYKGNRPSLKPQHYDELRKYLHEYHGFEVHKKQEADDAIGIAHAEITDYDPQEHVIIASIDKDLHMIPGRHYNIAKGETLYIPTEIARKNFYRQVLTGDRTDNIIGLKGIGPVKATQILQAGSHALMANRVCKAYSERGESQDRCMENAQLIWIRRELDYQFSFAYVDEVYKRYQ